MLLLAEPNLDTRFKHTVRGEQVAGSALALIDDTASEIVAVNVLPVPGGLKLVDIQVLQRDVLPLLGLLQGGLELWSSIIELAKVGSGHGGLRSVLAVGMCVRVRTCLGEHHWLSCLHIGVGRPAKLLLVH